MQQVHHVGMDAWTQPLGGPAHSLVNTHQPAILKHRHEGLFLFALPRRQSIADIRAADRLAPLALVEGNNV